MKKLFFVFASLALLTSVSSCKKCGYCAYPNGGGNSDAVCKETGIVGTLVDSYAEAEADCAASGGSWTKTK